MIKLEKTEVIGWEAAIRGMRNPMNSWDKSDSRYSCLCMDDKRDCPVEPYIIGPNDLELMMKLRNAGTDHRKFMRMLVVYVDITAPLYWWKEFDTYKVGTVANSCSTMHKIHEKEFTLEDFSCEHLINEPFPVTDEYVETYLDCITDTIKALNCARRMFLETKDKKYWWQMIQLLPSSYNQTRTVTMTYENIYTMRQQRKGHKLDEWRIDFFNWSDELPHLKELFD